MEIPDKKALQIQDLTVNYGSVCALSDINLDVDKGEYLGIIGPNGGGKTTLLKAILGLIPVTAGKIIIYGKEGGKARRLAGYVPQFSSLEKNFPITVGEVVLTGRLTLKKLFLHRYTREDRDAASLAMEQVGISSLSGRQIDTLSGGQFQKMLIARALAMGPELLLLDEPTASVDTKSREQIYELLAKLNQKMTIILVTHDTMAVSSKVNRLACLNGGLIYHGEPELTQQTVNRLYGCPVDLIAHGVPHRVLKTHEENS